MSKQKKYHFIYKTTCKVTGKFYVGMHSTDNLEDGYLGSGKILGYSRKKYGDENHVREIVDKCLSRDELKQRERDIVNEDLLKDPLNINLKYGGEGGQSRSVAIKNWQNAEFRIKHSNSLKQKWKDPSYRAACTTGIWRSQAMKEKHLAGKIDYATFTGKHHSKETRLKMSESHKGLQDGEKNSQFGTCWVTNGVKPIKIKKENLDEYLLNGYSRGRK